QMHSIRTKITLLTVCAVLVALGIATRIGVISIRKLGRKPVEYPHPVLEEILKPTYGIMVYQEQIMQTAQACAGFSLGKADILRRAMGKKKMDVMMSMKQEFVEGCEKTNNINKEKAGEIFDIMVKFAEYGFNRSHAAAYSIIAYQTAYLKAHYPAEYMAAILTHNLSDIKKISFFIDECRRLGIDVVGPNINESFFNFSVNKAGQILFGLAGIKGVGMSAVQEITDVREKDGPFKDVVDFLMRVNLRTVNKKAVEALASVGAFDCFPGIHRAQFAYRDKEDSGTFTDKLIRIVGDAKAQINNAQMSLFGEMENDTTLNVQFPVCPEFSLIQKLKLEKEGIGFYLSGHPLDQYRVELNNYTNCNLSIIKDLMENGKRTNDLMIGCMVTESVNGTTKNGSEYGRITIEDYYSSLSLALFNDDYRRFKGWLSVGSMLYITGSVFPKYYNQQFEFKITDISLLDTILDKNTRSVMIMIDSSDVNKGYVDNLYNLIKNNPGSCVLYINLVDRQQNTEVTLKVTGRKGVKPSTFIPELQTHNFKFLLNK
ncbi:MAG: DNA polymerase III subunit alpha, partial [Bacteroidales bacterium]|nr:DNA polymerase III subunit alpha [Bacteroidales bacterium]